MDCRRQRPSRPFQDQGSARSDPCKKNSRSLLESLESVVGRCAGSCAKASAAAMLREHILCALLCLGRRTLTGVIATSGKHDRDWTANYRLYSRNRVDPDKCFEAIRRSVERKLGDDSPLVVAIDDTIKQKTGSHIDGVSYRKDPLGPKFQANLVRAQRFIQFSAAIPEEDGSARLIPIDFKHAPSPRKPGPKADASRLSQYKEQCKQRNLNAVANERIAALREAMDSDRKLILAVDGSYANGTVIKSLPENATLIGRIRKDATLCSLPGRPRAKGRRRIYGEDMPTPEEIGRDQSIPWREVEAFAAGKRHRFRVKIVKKLLWRKAGGKRLLQLMIIAPLRYRLRKNSKYLYRKPAYLICTDEGMEAGKLLQYYLWRWHIEENFRDEKTLLGLGQAQVRCESSNRNLPAISVAAYSMLWLAALESHGDQDSVRIMQPPKWRRDLASKGQSPPTTSQLLRKLRYEMWAGSLRPASLSHFAPTGPKATKSQKCVSNLASSLFAAA